jgi:hypothetical protein
MPKKELYLILGCHGRIDEGFVSCSGTKNKILKIYPELEKGKELFEYIECLQLFTKPLIDYNAIRRMLFNIQERYYQNFKPIWSDKQFRLIENFTIIHKMCGLYIKLEYYQ